MRPWYLSVIKPDRHTSFRAQPLSVGARILATCLFIMAFAVPVSAQSPFGSNSSSTFNQRPAFLDVDDAFSFYISLDDSESISVHWTIAPGYYLYSDKFSFRITEPSESSTVIIPVMPAGTPHEDEFFGKVSVYYQQTRSILRLPEDIPATFLLEIGFQGCAEAGLCYPPELRHVEIVQ